MQEDLAPLRAEWVGNAEVILLFYRVDRRQTFEYCTEFWNDYVSQPDHDEDPPPTILVGNACDVSDSDRVVTYAEGAALARELGAASFCETSALQGTGITDLYNEAAVMCARARDPNGGARPRKKLCRVM